MLQLALRSIFPLISLVFIVTTIKCHATYSVPPSSKRVKGPQISHCLSALWFTTGSFHRFFAISTRIVGFVPEGSWTVVPMVLFLLWWPKVKDHLKSPRRRRRRIINEMKCAKNAKRVRKIKKIQIFSSNVQIVRDIISNWAKHPCNVCSAGEKGAEVCRGLDQWRRKFEQRRGQFWRMPIKQHSGRYFKGV